MVERKPSLRDVESRNRRLRNTQEVGSAVRGSNGTDHSVSAATSKTESDWRQEKKSIAEGPLCEGVHTRDIESPSAAYGKE